MCMYFLRLQRSGTRAAAVSASGRLASPALCASVHAAVPFASSALLRLLLVGAWVTSQRRVGCHSTFAWSWKTGLLTEPMICTALHRSQVTPKGRLHSHVCMHRGASLFKVTASADDNTARHFVLSPPTKHCHDLPPGCQARGGGLDELCICSSAVTIYFLSMSCRI